MSGINVRLDMLDRLVEIDSHTIVMHDDGTLHGHEGQLTGQDGRQHTLTQQKTGDMSVSDKVNNMKVLGAIYDHIKDGISQSAFDRLSQTKIRGLTLDDHLTQGTHVSSSLVKELRDVTHDMVTSENLALQLRFLGKTRQEGIDNLRDRIDPGLLDRARSELSDPVVKERDQRTSLSDGLRGVLELCFPHLLKVVDRIDPEVVGRSQQGGVTELLKQTAGETYRQSLDGLSSKQREQALQQLEQNEAKIEERLGDFRSYNSAFRQLLLDPQLDNPERYISLTTHENREGRRQYLSEEMPAKLARWREGFEMMREAYGAGEDNELINSTLKSLDEMQRMCERDVRKLDAIIEMAPPAPPTEERRKDLQQRLEDMGKQLTTGGLTPEQFKKTAEAMVELNRQLNELPKS
jgi:hypothetical protein